MINNNTGSTEDSASVINVGVSVIVADREGLKEMGSCLIEMPKVKYKEKDKKKAVAKKTVTRKTKDSGNER